LFSSISLIGSGSAGLATVPQIVIREHAGQHRLGDRHRANADTGIVPALGDDFDVPTIGIDRAARREDRGCRLDCEVRADL